MSFLQHKLTNPGHISNHRQRRVHQFQQPVHIGLVNITTSSTTAISFLEQLRLAFFGSQSVFYCHVVFISHLTQRMQPIDMTSDNVLNILKEYPRISFIKCIQVSRGIEYRGLLMLNTGNEPARRLNLSNCSQTPR